MKGRKGRPPNSKDERLAEVDQSIGATAWQLYCWGFALRRRVCPEVAKAARVIFSREIRRDRVEQLMETWCTEQWRARGYSMKCVPLRYTIRALRTRAPHEFRLDELAKNLLRHGGQWPHDSCADRMPMGDLELTAGSAAHYLCNRLTLKRGS